MKRPNPSFTVEIRRRPGRAAHPGATFAPYETKPPRGEVDRDTDRAIAAIFGPKRESSAPIAAAKSAPAGRVLDSLVIDRPVESEPVVEFSRGSETARDSRTVDESARRSKPRNVSAGTKARRSATSQQAETTLEPSPHSPIEEVARPVTPKPSALSRLATNGASPKTAIAKSTTSNKRQIVPKAAPAKPLLEIKNAIPVAVASPAPPAKPIEAAPARRKRMILARYVHGDELKPGERWKLRLRKKR